MKGITIKFLHALRVIFIGSGNHKKRDYILVPLYAIVIATIFRSLFFDHFHVPSGSMKSTLLIGDKITISKFSYGYSRYSLPFGIIPFDGRIFAKHAPERGDVVVFKLPTDRRTNYVKRLIGLPGDVISIKNGHLTINGKPLDRTQTADFLDDENGQYVKQYVETLPRKVGNIVHNELEYEENSIADNVPKIVVPDGFYFFMGDNRDRSLDSRFSKVGFVEEALILGKVQRIIISSNGSILNPLDWGKIRWERTWKKVQ